MKNRLTSFGPFHCGFKTEMHIPPLEEITRLCEVHYRVIEASSATTCETDHNSKIEFYDFTETKRHMAKSDQQIHDLNCVLFVRKEQCQADPVKPKQAGRTRVKGDRF